MVPVKVTIVSWNKNDPEGPSTFIAFGKMTEKGGVTYVRYEESKLTGMDKTTTTLKWSEQALTSFAMAVLSTDSIMNEAAIRCFNIGHRIFPCPCASSPVSWK